MTVRRIVKFGGSLLSRPEWPDQLRRWLQGHRQEQIVLMVGGGKMIDAIRDIDVHHRLPSDDVHWRCVQLLDATFDVVRWTLPELATIAQQSEWQSFVEAAKTPGIHLLRIAAYYVRETPDAENPSDGDATRPSRGWARHRLPWDWQTTTDAIAVAMAADAAADCVTLLKSCDPGPNAIVSGSSFAAANDADTSPFRTSDRSVRSPMTVADWRAAGWIDHATPAIARLFRGTIHLERLPD